MNRIYGLALAEALKKAAEETANPERAQLMEFAADEISGLIKEIKEMSKVMNEKGAK